MLVATDPSPVDKVPNATAAEQLVDVAMTEPSVTTVAAVPALAIVQLRIVPPLTETENVPSSGVAAAVALSASIRMVNAGYADVKKYVFVASDA